ncbi:MAG: hypothetical protein US49_C0005G0053 [candidate division TM6 bacterium GW2011_GWF2_37_49]|nr:MAG: hypothetical protein US49_C0005G0053 [candidate division TM6 bacterium GW2011_GWF2_37_49]
MYQSAYACFDMAQSLVDFKIRMVLGVNQNIKKCLLNIIPQEYSWKIILLEGWEYIIGDLKKNVIIEQIKEDVLFLGVVHPAWAQEMFALTPVLKQKINDYLGKEHIKSIRIKLKQTNKQNKKQSTNLQKLDFVQPVLTINEIENLNRIKNTELREVMQCFYLKCKEKRSL